MKTAVITGGSRGIGKAIAIKLSENKINVFLIATKEIHLKEVQNKINKIESEHGNCEIFVCDVTNKDKVFVFNLS